MSYDFGEGFIQINASFKGVIESITSESKSWGDAGGKSFAAAFNDEVRGSLNISLGPVTEQMAREGDTSAGAFADAFKARVEAALKNLPSASIDLDDTYAEIQLDEIRAKLSELGSKTIGVDLTAVQAYAQLDGLEVDLNRLSHDSPTIDIKVNAAAAIAELAAFQADVDALNRHADVDIDGSGSGSGGGFSLAEHSASGLLTTVVALGPALVPVTAGVIGLGVAGAAAFGAVALGAGTVALAASAVKKEISDDLTPTLHELQRTAASGILPGVSDDIAALIPEIPAVNRLVAGLSAEIGHLSSEAASGLTGGGFKGFFSYIDTDAVPVLDQFGHIIGDTAEGFAKLAVGFAPVTAEVGAGLEHMSADFAANAASSKNFQSFVAYIVSEGPAVAHTLESVAQSGEHVAAALAPVGATTLAVIHGFSDIVDHTPEPAIAALVVGLGSYLVAMKVATVATKTFGVSEEAATAALGPVGIALAAATLGLTAYESAKEHIAQEDQAAAGNVAAYTASLKINYGSVTSVASAVDDLREKQSAAGNALEALKASGISLGGVIKPLQTEYDGYGAAIGRTTTQGEQARSNAAALSEQYGISKAQVASLAGGYNNLRGPLTTVSASFKSLYTAAEATHQPLSQGAKDEKILGDSAATTAAQVSALSNQFGLMVGNSVNADQAVNQFYDGLVALDKALKKSSGSMDQQSASGRAAREQFDNEVTSIGNVITSQVNVKGVTEATRATFEKEIDTLQKHAGSSAYAAKEIAALRAELAKVPSVAGAASGALTKAAAKSVDAGVDFSSGFAAGIKDGDVLAIHAASALGLISYQAAKNAIQSQSPSKLLHDLGLTGFDQGFADGITDGSPIVEASARSMAILAGEAVKAATATVMKEIRVGIAPATTDPTQLADALTGSINTAVNKTVSATDSQSAYKQAQANSAAAAEALVKLKNADAAAEAAAKKHAQALSNEASAAHTSAENMADSTKAEQAAKDAAEEHARALDQEARLAGQTASALVDADNKKEASAEKYAESVSKQAEKAKEAYTKASDAAKAAAAAAVAAAQALVTELQSEADAMTGTITDFESTISSGLTGDDSLATLWTNLVDAQTTAASNLTDATTALASAQDQITQDQGTDGGVTPDDLNALAAAQTNYNNALDDYNTATANESVSGLQANLDQILAQTQQFATDLQTIISDGGNQSEITELVGLGPVAGDQLAQELITAGSGAINQLGDSLDQIQSYSNSAADQIAQSFYGAGTTAMENFIEGLMTQFPELVAALQPVLTELEGAFGLPTGGVTGNPPSVPLQPLGSGTPGGANPNLILANTIQTQIVGAVPLPPVTTVQPQTGGSLADQMAMIQATLAQAPALTGAQVGAVVGDKLEQSQQTATTTQMRQLRKNGGR